MQRLTVEPIWVGDFDVADPVQRLVPAEPSSRAKPYSKARLLIRCRFEPLGLMMVDVDHGEIDVDAVRDRSISLYRSRIEEILCRPLADSTGHCRLPDKDRGPGLSAELGAVRGSNLPAISVVIGTRNRPHHVVECVEHLLKQDYPAQFEVLVVENTATGPATADAVRHNFDHDDRVRYLSDARPGLSRARNIGLAAARYPICAFLSDDIRVDPPWLLCLARGFGRHENVRAVTGFCPPLYLETVEQLRFEALMAWGSRQGFEPTVFGLTSDSDALHPYRPGAFANGSTMAFDTEFFRRLGGFDERLGPGTKARGGEDLDAAIQVLLEGAAVAYEPAAVGWHADRYDDRPFPTRMYTYGMGLTAFLTKHLFDPRSRPVMLSRIPKGLPLAFKTSTPADPELGSEVAIGLGNVAAHTLGRLAGPVAYARSCWCRQRSPSQ